MDLLKLRIQLSMEEYDNLFGVTFQKVTVELHKDQDPHRKKFRVQCYSNHSFNCNNASGNQPHQANRLAFAGNKDDYVDIYYSFY